jgi:hypothetical protein
MQEIELILSDCYARHFLLIVDTILYYIRVNILWIIIFVDTFFLIIVVAPLFLKSAFFSEEGKLNIFILPCSWSFLETNCK